MPFYLYLKAGRVEFVSGSLTAVQAKEAIENMDPKVYDYSITAVSDGTCVVEFYDKTGVEILHLRAMQKAQVATFKKSLGSLLFLRDSNAISSLVPVNMAEPDDSCC